jgi:hypothetical protein
LSVHPPFPIGTILTEVAENSISVGKALLIAVVKVAGVAVEELPVILVVAIVELERGNNG